MIFKEASSFPLVDKYLREEMPKVVEVPAILHFMWRLGKLNKKDLASALNPGELPMLIPFRTAPDGFNRATFLVHTKRSGRQHHFETDVVQRFRE